MGRDGPAGDAHLPFAHIPAWHKCSRRVVTLSVPADAFLSRGGRGIRRRRECGGRA